MAYRKLDRGLVSTPEYRSWSSMKNRCCCKTSRVYKSYGAKGVTVCDRWKNSFAAFLEDMGPRPTLDHSLDRYPDNNGNHEPGNCRWATPTEQSRNRRNTALTEQLAEEIRLAYANGERCKDLADRLGLKYQVVYPAAIGRTWKHAPAATTQGAA